MSTTSSLREPVKSVGAGCEHRSVTKMHFTSLLRSAEGESSVLTLHDRSEGRRHKILSYASASAMGAKSFLLRKKTTGCDPFALGFGTDFAQHDLAESKGGYMRTHGPRFRGAYSALVLGLISSPAWAQASYSDPAGSGVLVSAVNWLQGTLLGTIATVAAIIAVAAVGFMMLTGRINWRYGATVILGCFVLFGAASIVAGIQSTATLAP